MQDEWRQLQHSHQEVQFHMHGAIWGHAVMTSRQSTDLEPDFGNAIPPSSIKLAGRIKSPEIDEDGDVIVQRKEEHVLTVYSSPSSNLQSVGLQVWQGALLLADYILEQGEACSGCIALEVGAGTGLAGIVLGRVAARVFLTDVERCVLDNCQRNVDANASSFRLGPQVAKVRRLDLDFATPEDPGRCGEGAEVAEAFDWRPEDIAELREVSLVLAGDVIYDDDLTLGFMRCMDRFLRPPQSCPGPVLLVSVEKRVNFTVRKRAAQPHAYDFWRTLFRADAAEGDDDMQTDGKGWPTQLVGQQIAVRSLPQSHPLQRSDDVELWRLQWEGSTDRHRPARGC